MFNYTYLKKKIAHDIDIYTGRLIWYSIKIILFVVASIARHSMCNIIEIKKMQ